jgi:hypothetical protein
MTTGATGQLGLALPVQGELSGTWGDTVNNGITQYTNIAIAGTLTLTNDGAVTLANTTGDASASNITSTLTGAGTVTAQFAIVKVTGTLTVAKVVTAPSYSKTYTVVNSATGGIVTFKASGQTGVSIAVGETAFVYFNGTDYVKVAGTVNTGVTSFSAGTTGFTPSTATTGAVTLAGTLVVGNGGTGLTSLTTGSLTYGAGTSAFSTLAIGTAGQILTVNSGATAPQWSTLSGVAVTTLSFGTTGLTPSTATSGVITVAGTLITSNGGTGLSSYTAGDLPYFATGTALSKLGIGAANRVLTSTGSAPQWVASLTGLTSVSATTFTENGYAVVSQADIGTADNEIPLNQYLGSMAYQNGTDYYNVGMTMGFRNRFINGAMQIDQRNAGASVSVTDSNQYTLDRWQGVASLSSSKFTVQQSSTAPSGFSNSLLATSSSAYSVLSSDYFLIRQKIEGFNTSDLAWGTSSAKSVTISFWVYSSLTGSFGGAVTNSANSYSYPFSYTVNSANTWEQKTISIPGPTAGTWIGATNGIGLQLKLSLGSGSTYSGTAGSWQSADLIQPTGSTSVVGTSGATFYITGIQLEVGTQATPFDVRPYATEFTLCQRYFQTLAVSTGSAAYISGFVADSTSTGFGIAFLPVPMRTAPSLAITLSGGTTKYRVNAGTVNDNSNTDPVIGQATTTSFRLNFNSGFTTLVANVSGWVNNRDSTGGYFGVTAEL